MNQATGRFHAPLTRLPASDTVAPCPENLYPPSWPPTSSSWATSAFAALSVAVHALHHEHDGADVHWQRVAQGLSHGHERGVNTPKHCHPAFSAAAESLSLPRCNGSFLLVNLGVEIRMGHVATWTSTQAGPPSAI